MAVKREGQELKKPLTLKNVLFWYLLCSLAIFVVMAYGHNNNGGCTPGGIVYCYGDSRDYWWHPNKILVSFVIVLFLPVPHILIALFFKTKRSVAAALSIARSWHKGAASLFIGLSVIAFLSSQVGKGIEQKLDVKAAASEQGRQVQEPVVQTVKPAESLNQEEALRLALTCASLKKKLGRADEAVEINGYVIYKLTEIGISQEAGQNMIFDAVGKANALYAENSHDRARVEKMEKESCLSAKAQLPELPGVL
jgi:hypothetical protein